MVLEGLYTICSRSPLRQPTGSFVFSWRPKLHTHIISIHSLQCWSKSMTLWKHTGLRHRLEETEGFLIKPWNVLLSLFFFTLSNPWCITRGTEKFKEQPLQPAWATRYVSQQESALSQLKRSRKSALSPLQRFNGNKILLYKIPVIDHRSSRNVDKAFTCHYELFGSIQRLWSGPSADDCGARNLGSFWQKGIICPVGSILNNHSCCRPCCLWRMNSFD